MERPNSNPGEKGEECFLNRGKTETVIIIFLFLALPIIFSRALWGEFLEPWDDQELFLTNLNYRGLDWPHLRWILTTTQFPAFYIPISWLAWGATYVVWGMNPVGYHLDNGLCHLVNVLLVNQFIRKLLSLGWSSTSRPNQRWLDLCSGFGALVWGLHPLSVEVVAATATFPYALSSTFFLTSLLAYLRAASRSDRAMSQNPLFWLACLTFGMSMLSYPFAVAGVAIYFILDFYPLKRLERSVENRWFWGPRRIWFEKFPFMTIAALEGWITLTTRKTTTMMAGRAMPSLADFGFTRRLWVACYGWTYYFWKPFFPLSVSPIYTRLFDRDLGAPVFWMSALFVLFLSGVLIHLRQRWPMLLALWLAHLSILVPALGFNEFPYSMSDRYGYLQRIAWSVFASAGLLKFASRLRSGFAARALATCLALFCATLGLLSARQIAVWHDGGAFFEEIIRKVGNHPYREDAYRRWAIYLNRRGQYEQALDRLARSIQINPNSADTFRIRGLMELEHGNRDGAACDFQLSLSLQPEQEELRLQWGDVLVEQGKTGEAVAVYAEALNRHPKSPAAVHTRLGNLHAAQGNYEEAAIHFAQALQTESENAEFHYNLANSLVRLNRNVDAVSHYKEALRLKPGFTDARYNLGTTLAQEGKTDEAAVQFKEVLRLHPDDASAHNKLGIVLSMKGDLEEAIQHFTQALKIKPDFAEAQTHLAKARADLDSKKSPVSQPQSGKR